MTDLLHRPTEPIEPHQSEAEAPEKDKIRAKRVGLKALGLIGGITGAGAATALILGSVLGNGEATSTSPDDENADGESVSAPLNPGEQTGGSVEQLFNLKDGFSIEKFSSPEQLGTDFMEKFGTDWYNAGANEENRQAMLNNNSMSRDEYANMLAEKNRKAYGNALFVDGWDVEGSPLKAWADQMAGLNAQTISLYFSTANPDLNPADKEPYHRDIDVVSFIDGGSTSTTWVTVLETNDTDNQDKNHAAELVQGHPLVDGPDKTGTATFTWTQQNNEWQVEAISY